MDEHILEAYIVNAQRHTEQAPVAEWVPLPTTGAELQKVFERIGVDGGDPEQYAVAGYASPIDALAERLQPGTSLDELNYLASLLERQRDEDRDKFAAAVAHGDHAGSVADIINLTHNLDCYWLYPTIHNTEDYGHYLVNELDEPELSESAKKYFDYKSYGRDAAQEDGGSFTDYGYIYNNKNDYAEWYKDHAVPQEYSITPQEPTRLAPEKMDYDAIGPRQPAVATATPPLPVTPLVLTGQNNTERMKEITDKLEAGIQALFDSDQYAAYLKAMSKFHNYSFNNTLLIVMQKPDASLIAGFSKWKTDFDRSVKKGEKGIKILAPAPFKVKKDMERIDPKTQRPIMGGDGKPLTDQVEVTIPAFKPVTVFDVSQTEGKDVPDISVDALTGDVEQYRDFFAALEKTSPVPVAFEAIGTGANGYYHQIDKRIAIKEGMSELQTVKTAIHEIAHAKLHSVDKDAPEEEQPQFDRRTREVQAESVAYAVCLHYGLDTSDYSFGYVAGWSSGREVKELKASLETIRTAANELITEIDGHFAELQQQREAAEQAAPVMENITPEQRQEIRDEVQATLQMLVDADMQRQGEVTQGTRDAIQTQGYELHDGRLYKPQPGYEAWSEPATPENAPDNPGLPSDNVEAYIADKRPPAPECEAAYRLDDGNYLYIQVMEYGYDYSLFDPAFQEIDGGQLENTELSMLAARDEILAAHEIKPFKIETLSMPEFMRAQEAAAQAAPLIDTPELIAAELFTVAKDFDPEFMQKYADRQDEQISATVTAIKDGDTFAMDAMMLHISQDENTPAPVRSRAAELIRRMNDYKELNNTYSIYQLKGGEETRDYRFEPLDRLQARGLAVNRDNYELVYSAPLHDIDTLEDIYRKFNQDHPADFTGHSLSVSDVVVLRHGDRQTAHYCDSYGFTKVPQFLQEQQPTLTPDEHLTGEKIRTPRGNFSLTSMSVEQMKAAGYSFHHSSDDGKYSIMTSNNRAFAVAVEPPEKSNPLKTAELSTEQNENMLDGRINNTPSVGELEAKVKAGETISLTDLAAAVKNERKAERGKPQKKPSIRAQLKADKEAQSKKQAAKTKTNDLEV